MELFKDFWLVFKDEILELFKELNRNGNFVKSRNSTFIVLIAKEKKRPRILETLYLLAW